MHDPSIHFSRRAFLKLLALSGVVVTLDACDSGSPTPFPDEIATASPATAIPQSADVTARTFLQAWSQNNFAGMFATLSPTTQAKVSEADFVQRYQDIVREATITKITPTLTAVAEEGSTATAQYHVRYETALLGTLEQDNAFSLVRERGQWGIIWAPRLIFKELEGGNRLKLYVSRSTRGNIYDRNGAPIGIGVKAIVVNVWPAEMQRHGTEAQVLAALEGALNLSQADIQKRYAGQNPEWKIPIQTISQDVAQQNADALSLPGVVAEEQDARQYPLGAAAGHISGYVGQISADELDELYGQGYREGETFGRAGLEQLGERYLSGGRGGTLVALDAEGKQVAEIARRETEQSRSIFSTIDADLQQYAATLLADKRGSITVMDVRNGEILAMYSNPGYDPNAFVDRNRNTDRTTYLTSPQKVMLNRSAQGAYPHGSVQKIITAAAALERGGMVPGTPFLCTGTWNGIGYPKSCWITAYGKTHGNISLAHALTASCDIAFYQTGLRLHQIDANLLTDFCYAFGLGSDTGIGIPENAGNVPDPRKQENWIPTDTVDMAIGQDTFLVSPLQVVDFVAGVANGGTLWRPNLISKVRDFVNGSEQAVAPQKRGDLPVSQNTIAVLHDSLKGVTTDKDGTATFAFDRSQVICAGKTGTAQVPGKNDPHAWFAGYAPADNPQIACVVMVENGGEGSKVSAPLFRKVIEKYFKIPPTPTPGPRPKGTPAAPTGTPPPAE